MEVIVKALPGFVGKKDVETNSYHQVGDEWKTSLERAEYLVKKNAVVIVRQVETKKPVVTIEVPKTEKVTDEMIKKYSKFVEEEPIVETTFCNPLKPVKNSKKKKAK